MKITNKKDMYRLAEIGALGNVLRHWSVEEFHCRLVLQPQLCAGTYGVRDTRPGTGIFKRHMGADETLEYVASIVRRGLANGEDLIVSEDTWLLDGKRILQGEVFTDNAQGLTLRFHSIGTSWSCRDEVREIGAREVHGLMAKSYLDAFLDVPSREWMDVLLYELYPDSVVEFTAFSQVVGLMRWNTLFWEVRNY